MKVASQKRPPARSSHTACCIAGPLTGQEHPILMVVGGWNVKKALSDVWLLDVDKWVWSEVGMLYLIVLPVIYKHADSYSKPVCTHRNTFSRQWRNTCTILVVSVWQKTLPCWDVANIEAVRLLS